MADPRQRGDYVELEFDKAAALVHPEQLDGVSGLAGRVDDVVVLAHGWNNDTDEARGLYDRWTAGIDQLRAAGREPGLGGRTLGFVGVLWPSKRFADADLIPGGAASTGDPDPGLADDLRASADAFAAGHARATLDEAADLVAKLPRSPKARARYAELLRSLLDPATADRDGPSTDLFALDGEELFRRADDPTLGDPDILAPPAGGTGGALGVPAGGTALDPQGGAAGLGFGDLLSGGRNLLNFVTYYEMKDRAGQVGAALGPRLAERVLPHARLHAVGHSFGARLVTAAAATGVPAGGVRSLSLLQAAFSHYAFAKDWEPGADGLYRPVLTAGTLGGPMVVTHTRNDTAVGIAYAVASRIAGQVAAAIGDADSRFGGLGGNGAQRTPEAVPGDLHDENGDYAFAGGRVHNLRADPFVSGHSDVSGPPVVHAVLRAVAAGSA